MTLVEDILSPLSVGVYSEWKEFVFQGVDPIFSNGTRLLLCFPVCLTIHQLPGSWWIVNKQGNTEVASILTNGEKAIKCITSSES